MLTVIDPKEFNLPPRTVLVQVDEKTIAIVIDRKSRILMTDGRKIKEKVKCIRKIRPGTRVILRTSAPVCSRTKDFLASGGIDVVNYNS